MLKFYPLQLLDKAPEGEEAICLKFAVPDALIATFTGRAGQHVVLAVPIDGAEVRRSYSLVSAPGEFPLRIGVRVHDRGRMSRYLAGLQPGDELQVMPPNGSFVSAHQDADGVPRSYVGFAAGCGITPVLALIKAKLAREPACRWVLFYGNRDAGRAMFLEELLGLKDRYMERFAVHFVMSREPQEVEIFNGRLDGEKLGLLTGRFFAPAQIDEFFLCGPNDMISALGDGLDELGVPPERVHTEHFTVDTVPAAERVEKARPVSAGSAEVTVIMDGRRRSFTMAPEEETVLEAALAAGIDLPYSCCAGVCSTCRTRAIDGKVEMAENYALEAWEVEQGYVLACQSRPVGTKLVLDYDDV